ncbi:Cytochrome c peroxidase [Singulisphaera sp. GP187]|uniref:cytochrome c peroxidase n=1 Tax=Singulisphaera sp. GP187 TaxID=1882752 RepID=UPI0009268404|nr:cytochrome c peroxidase [Singulisphaera sp. GP187]SIO59756.1 Cytochrome c peroxidase [Singulisphaera sp. GP187]
MRAMIRGAGLWFGVLLTVVATVVSAQGAERSEPTSRDGPKVPVALVWGPDDRLHVALREARRVITIDSEGWQVVAAWPLTVRPVSLTRDETGSTFFVGGADGEALVLDRAGRVVRTLPTGNGPTRILPLAAGQVAVASLWDAAVRIIDWRQGQVVATHRLPFPVGALVRTPAGRVVVADAFGGHLADLVPGRPGTERVRVFEGVNLAAVAVSEEGKELLVIHMEQLEPAPITVANIDRGIILSSRLSGVPLAEFDAGAEPGEPLSRRQVTLDGPVHGAADPSALALSPDGTQIFITLAGSHQVLKNDRTNGGSAVSGAAPRFRPLGHNQRLQVLEVGRSPVALAFDRSGQHVVTADSMSDRISVVKVADLSRVATVELSPGPVVRTPEQRGEALFHDGRRALDRWMSCSSCHKSGHTNGLNFDTLGDGGFGAPKNTPSLLGVAGTEPSAWNGSLAQLADQVHQSLDSSLRGPDPAPGMVQDLVAYLESLKPPPPRRARDDPAAQRGAALFRSRRCETCHRPPAYTIAGLRDVGLDDGSGGNRSFNPPSLLGVAWSAPYFHDGRAATLAQVVESHSPGQKTSLSPEQRDDLIAFLESL